MVLVKIHGTLYTAAAETPSDRRMKRNIESLKDSLDKVGKLQGVHFDWKTDKFPEHGFQSSKQIGLIAQDVEKVLPELVHTDKEGYKSVSYQKLTAVLVEAVKEMKAQYETEIKDLKVSHEAEIEELKRMVLEMKKAMGENSSGDTTLKTSMKSAERTVLDSLR